MAKMKKRCEWAESDPLLKEYHDKEWGVPVHDDKKLFEFIVLEGMQAGLSWSIVLRKRDSFRKAFNNFDPKKIARYDKRKTKELLHNPAIIRNRLKIEAAIKNAQAFLAIQKEFGSLDKYMWQFVDGKPKINNWKKMSDLPARSAESDAMSLDLKKRGFRFVGSTICYAHMQAVGMVNDHTVDCFRYKDLKKLSKRQ